MFKSSSSPSMNDRDNKRYQSYLVPSIYDKKELLPRTIINDRIISWLKSAIEEGEGYLKTQLAYQGLDNVLNILKGEFAKELGKFGTANQGMSEVMVNYTKRAIREQVSILSNIRPSTTYEPNSSSSPEWIRHSQILNACSRSLYQSMHIRSRFKEWIQYASVQGTGYLLNEWNPHYYSPNVGEIVYRAKPFNKVLFIGMGDSTNIQDAYATIIVEDPDIRKAWRMFPKLANIIQPIQDSAMKAASKQETVGYFSSLRSAFQRSKNAYATDSTRTRLYYIYVKDYAVNPSNSPIIMGEKSWQYTVPYIGQELGEGRIATEEDCLLYPNLRLIICTDTDVLYDNTSFYWHGRFPVVKYAPDEWAMSFLGFSVAAETVSLNTSLVSTLRGIDDGLALALDPPAMIDDTLTSAKEANRSLRKRGRKIRGRLSMGDFLKPFMPPNAYLPTPLHSNHIEKLEQYIDRLTGLKDLRNLQQARQIPSSETIEKFQTEAGSVAEDMSLSMDTPLWQLADMNRFNFFQFYNKQRRLRLYGDYGVANEDDDRDKSTLIPFKPIQSTSSERHIQFFDFDPTNILPVEEFQTSTLYLTREMRARVHVSNFSTHIDPKAAHEITHINTKMLYLQAYKVSPFLIDHQTLAETLNIPNYGKLKGDTVIERCLAFAELQKDLGLRQQFDASILQLVIQLLGMQAQQQPTAAMQEIVQKLLHSIGVDLQQTANSVGLQQPPQPQQPAQSMPSLDTSPVASSPPSLTSSQEGRPPTLRQQPRLIVKNDENRSTISSS